MFTGHIYNNEGKALEGIRVSDGRNIAVTDSEGYYSLPGWERANVISVQMLTENHDDWFRYIDREHSVYDFYVTPYSCEDNVSFIHFSDTEIFLDGAFPHLWLGFVKNCVKERSPGFIIHTGDICRRKGLEYHRIAMNSQNMGVSVRYTLGNHDYVADKYGEYTFERLYGPIWYSFDLGNTHFVILPITKGEAPSLYKPEDCAEWFSNDLALVGKEKSIIMFCHDSNPNFEKDGTFKSGSKIVDLNDYNALAWVFGHHHAHYAKTINGRYHIGTGRPDFGGIDGVAAACRYVKIEKDGSLFTALDFNKKDSDTECEVKRIELENKICYTSPVYAEGSIFVATFSPNSSEKGKIFKLSTNGDILASIETDSDVKWSMAYFEDSLFALDDHGTVYHLDTKDLTLKNKFSLSVQTLPIYSGGIVVDADKLYISTNNSILELDARSGERIRLIDDPNLSSISSTTNPIFTDKLIIKGNHWRGMCAIERDGGQSVWFNKTVVDSVANPILVDSEIIAPTRYRVIKLNLDGKIIAESASHSERFYNTHSSPLYYNGKLYVPTTEVGIMVLDAETLEELYTLDCEGSLIASGPYTGINYKSTFGNPIVKDETVIFTAADGCIYFYGVNDRALKKKINIGHPLLSGVVEIDGGYCVCDFDGGLSFFN